MRPTDEIMKLLNEVRELTRERDDAQSKLACQETTIIKEVFMAMETKLAIVEAERNEAQGEEQRAVTEIMVLNNKLALAKAAIRTLASLLERVWKNAKTNGMLPVLLLQDIEHALEEIRKETK